MIKVSRSFIQSALALALLALVFLFVSPAELLSQFLSISIIHLGLLICISIALVWISAAKWRLFLGEDAPSTSRLFRFYLIGYFVNSFVPSYVGGDAARSYLAGKRSGQVTAASATILERYTGLLAMFGLGMLASVLPLGIAVPLAVRLTVLALGLALICATALVLSAWSFNLICNVLPSKISAPLGKVRSGLIVGLRNRKALGEALLLSLIYHCFTVLNTAVAAYAVGWNTVPLAQLFVVLPIILTIGGLPITPSGLGLQEGAFVYFLTLLGATRPESLAIGVLLRAKTYLLALVGWGCFAIEQRRGSGHTIQDDVKDEIAAHRTFGTGRAHLVVLGDDQRFEFSDASLSADFKITQIVLKRSFDTDVWKIVDHLEEFLDNLGVRSGVFVGVGDAASIVQVLTLRSPKIVRSMVLIDATTRSHPTWSMRLVDRVEQFLPLGLPFRSNVKGFDSLSLIHRLRSPCVIAVSSEASTYQRKEAVVLAERLPTAVVLHTEKSRGEVIREAVVLCRELPAKCPQKNRTSELRSSAAGAL